MIDVPIILESNICFSYLQPIDLLTFSTDAKARNFVNKFLLYEEPYFRKSEKETKIMQTLTLQFYHSITRDTVHALRIYIDLQMVRARISNSFFISVDIITFVFHNIAGCS